MTKQHGYLKAYKGTQAESLTPLEKILIVTEKGIRAAQAHDSVRVSKVLTVLRSALDYNKCPEIAMGLDRLYVYAEKGVEQQNFTEVIRVLISLKKSWIVASEQEEEREGQ